MTSVATEAKIYAVLSCGAFLMLFMVVLTFKSVDKIVKCDHSNESHRGLGRENFYIVLFANKFITFVK